MFYIICVNQLIHTNMTTQNNIQTLLAEIATRTAELKAAIEKYDNDPEAQRYYWGGYSHARRIAAEIGLENVFYVGENYRGLYQDDYCTFTFFNNLTGEFFYDEWTTAAACPACDSYYEGIYTVKEGLELGLIDMEKVFELNKKRFESMVESNAEKIFRSESLENNGFFPRVKVSKGRKWRGEGYLVDLTTNVYHFGPTYGRSYNTSTSTTARILSLEDFQIHYCNADYLEFVEVEKITEMYKVWAKNLVYKMFQDLYNSKYYFNQDTLTWKILPGLEDQCNFSVEKFFERHNEMVNHISRMNIISARAYDAKVEEERKAYSTKLAEQLPNVIEWVKENTDKTTDDEIMGLALHILNKRN